MPSRRRALGLSAALAFAAAPLLSATPAPAQSLPRAGGGETPVKRLGTQSGCGPTIIISHGFGGDENGNAHLAVAMAMQGWRVLVMGHRESGRQQLRQAMMSGAPRDSITAAARSPEAFRARFHDLDAAVADITRVCRPKPLVFAGHSMGAMTVMLEAGATATFGRYGSNRFDAYVAISPQGVGSGFTRGSWTGVTRPVLMITGTRDQAAEGGPETRLSAFEGLPPGRKRLAIIPEATHLQLAANAADPVGRMVAALTLEFTAALTGNPRLPASAIRDVDIRDK
jgi:alpha-beta hydrolase superfamily lysophospholipase